MQMKIIQIYFILELVESFIKFTCNVYQVSTYQVIFIASTQKYLGNEYFVRIDLASSKRGLFFL